MKSFILLFACVASGIAFAQQDPEALKTLNAVSEKYKNMTFTAEFDYSIKNKTAGVDESFQGNIAVKGRKYRMKTSELEVLNDGTDLYNYIAEANEVNIATYYPEDEEIGIHNIFDIYQDGYKYALTGEEADGSQVIDLEPIERKTFFKIRMVVNKSVQVNQFIIFDRNGNVYTYSIKNFREKADIGDDFFVFNAADYDGIDIIDFR